MRYHEAANFLLDLRRFSPRPGTEPTRELLSFLGDPHESLTAVQVAGSNGKGSTARMLGAVLEEAGLDVGMYTSPHLEDVRERVTVNGRVLSKADLVAFVDAIDPYVTEHAASGDSPTFFETLTALALWEFDRSNVDVAVLEVGIGGRHDATSVVDPVASAVTNVTLEHTDFLGETVEEIARDKAAVATDRSPLVTAATGDALRTIEATAGDVLRVGESSSDRAVTVDYQGREGLASVLSIAGPDWGVDTRLPLLGAHQARNAAVAAALARQVTDVTESELAAGLGRATWPGRFEVFDRDPLVVLDGGHNPGGCSAVTSTLSSFSYGDLHLVVGAMCDKDHRGMASALPDPDSVIATRPAVERAEDEAVLAQAFAEETDADVSTRSSVAEGLQAALSRAGDDDAVLVAGSLYAVREARTHWTQSIIPKRVESLSDGEQTLEQAHVTDEGITRRSSRAVHHVLKTRLNHQYAQYLESELRSVGGECAIAGVETRHEEPLDVVMMGTLEQFADLADRLASRSGGLTHLAEELRDTLGLERSDRQASPWSNGTAVMGILNVTPDSFHDGGEYNALEDALARADAMIEAGVDIIDVGGESTRPGADPVPVETECDRVLPVIERLADRDVTVSIDTRKVTVARAALDAGADILNDVSGLEDPAMAALAAEHDAPVVVMHSIDTPVDPDHAVHYDDVVGDVIEELRERVLLAEKAGLDRSQILVDPGLGFGKTAAESFELLDRLGELRALGCPILVGHSQKSMFDLVGRDADERDDPTVAATALAAARGADVIRVHDVAANRAAVDVAAAADDPTSFDS